MLICKWKSCHWTQWNSCKYKTILISSQPAGNTISQTIFADAVQLSDSLFGNKFKTLIQTQTQRRAFYAKPFSRRVQKCGGRFVAEQTVNKWKNTMSTKSFPKSWKWREKKWNKTSERRIRWIKSFEVEHWFMSQLNGMGTIDFSGNSTKMDQTKSKRIKEHSITYREYLQVWIGCKTQFGPIKMHRWK